LNVFAENSTTFKSYKQLGLKKNHILNGEINDAEIGICSGK
jgi:hypothetical protein